MLSGKVEAMRDAEAALRGAQAAEGFKVAATVYESRDFSMIDVLHPHCSKGAALAEWATLRGVTREEVMAVGDNHNDLEMLSFAGSPGGDGQLRRGAEKFWLARTASNDHNGVAAAIELFALREVAPCG